MWNPRARPAPEVGQRTKVEGDFDLSWKTETVTARSYPDVVNTQQRCAWRYAKEVLAVQKGEAIKERVDIERWSCTDETGATDSSLEGKTVMITGAGGRRRADVKGQKGALGGAARTWMDNELVPPVDRVLEVVYPKAPVRSGQSWEVDPIGLAIRWNLHELSGILPEGSEATGKLSGVRVTDGVHVGDMRVEAELALGSFPKTQMPWKSGGVFHAKVSASGPLERAYGRAFKIEVNGKLEGKAEGRSPSGAAITASTDLALSGKRAEETLEPPPKPVKKKKKGR